MDTTTQPLTAEKLEHFQKWFYETASKTFKPLNELKTPGTYWVYVTGKYLGFENLNIYCIKKETINKVSKLKVGDNYRNTWQGWIVPDELIEQFKECLEVSRAYAALRREAIDVATKLPWNGYNRIKNLTPEKMQALIDLFADSDE